MPATNWDFLIVPTPGWQYWNKDLSLPLVYQNTRDIIRRGTVILVLLM